MVNEPNWKATGCTKATWCTIPPSGSNRVFHSHLFDLFEQATNLSAPVFWQTIGEVVGAGETIRFTDPKATNDTRFCRIRIE